MLVLNSLVMCNTHVKAVLMILPVPNCPQDVLCPNPSYLCHSANRRGSMLYLSALFDFKIIILLLLIFSLKYNFHCYLQ